MNYNFVTKIGDKTINCRAFTLREYKDLLKAKLEGRLEEEILELFKKCTDAPELPRHEGELLLVKLWAQSLGEVNVERPWHCACGREQMVPMNLIQASTTEAREVVWGFTNFKIRFRWPNIFQDKYKAQTVAECIHSIVTPDDVEIFPDDLSDEEVNDLYSAITVEDIEKIFAHLTEPQVQLAVPISCECGHNEIHVVKGLKEFFKLI